MASAQPLLAQGSTSPALNVSQYSNKQIEKIDIVLNRVTPGSSFDPNTIRARMKTKVGGNFSQLDFDEDLKHLADEFDRVEPAIEERNDKIYITLKIWPKPTIRSIQWHGNSHIRTKELQKELDVKLNSTFDRHNFNQAFNKLKAYYVKEGYFEAELNYRVVPDANLNDVDIEVDIKEGRSGRVKKVIFKGFSKHEEDHLLDMVHTKKYFFLTSWVTGDGTYQEEVAEQDKYIVLDYLHNQGYADAKVDLKVIEAPNKESIYIEFTADKGERYKIGKLSFSGNKVFSDEEVRKHLRVKKGEPFSPEELRETVKTLTDAYGAKGYIEATVNYEPHLAHDAPLYDVEFSIHEGEQYRIGLIKVYGNNATSERVILHESLLVPGEVFDIRKLQKTEETLKNIGYFENVNVYAVKSGDDKALGPNYRDVHIEVEEKGTGTFSLFAGYSSLDSVFGGVEIVERNFNYKGIPRLFSKGPKALRGDGEFLRLRGNIGTKTTSYMLSWAKPFIHDTPWILGFDADRSTSKRQSDDYELKSYGFATHATYPVNRFFRVSTHYRLRHESVHLEGGGKENTLLDRESRNDGDISAVGVTLVFDSVNHPLRPTNGFRSQFDTEIAGLGGAHRFLLFAYQNTYYVQVYKSGVLKFRGDARFLQPLFGTHFHTLPLNERFFMGGETTVRGYASYRIGPLYSNLAPRGGISAMLFSTELNHSFNSRFSGFLFFDAGYASKEAWEILPFRTSLGFGVRVYMMENMPLMVGYGFPLNPERRGDVQRFFFSIGGNF